MVILNWVGYSDTALHSESHRQPNGCIGCLNVISVQYILQIYVLYLFIILNICIPDQHVIFT